MKPDLKELETSLAGIKTSITQLKADCGMSESDKMYQTMWSAFDQLYSYCDKIKEMVYKVSDNSWGMMDEHMEKSTHLPKLTASQTEALLKSCKADGDFDVMKPVMFCRANAHGGNVIEVDFQKQKK